MGVLATFDEQANWAQTHVCDDLLEENLARWGAAWGRWKAHAPWPADGPLQPLLERRRIELAQLHERFGTKTVERLRLSPKAIGWQERRREWRRLHARNALVHWVLEGTLLVYLRTDSGHVGVLCEAGEWLALPAGSRYARDAGEAPDVDLLVLSAAALPTDVQDEVQADPGLPSFDEFVETLLELTGHAADE